MVAEQDRAMRMFLDCLTTLTNVTGVRCETVQVIQNDKVYWLKWEVGQGYVINAALAEAVQQI